MNSLLATDAEVIALLKARYGPDWYTLPAHVLESATQEIRCVVTRSPATLRARDW